MNFWRNENGTVYRAVVCVVQPKGHTGGAAPVWYAPKLGSVCGRSTYPVSYRWSRVVGGQVLGGVVGLGAASTCFEHHKQRCSTCSTIDKKLVNWNVKHRTRRSGAISTRQYTWLRRPPCPRYAADWVVARLTLCTAGDLVSPALGSV